MPLAKRLPITDVPKQLLVTIVRLDMINYLGWCNDCIPLLAIHAQRMLDQVCKPSLAPLIRVASRIAVLIASP
jgi:hypothetical protein